MTAKEWQNLDHENIQRLFVITTQFGPNVSMVWSRYPSTKLSDYVAQHDHIGLPKSLRIVSIVEKCCI